MSRRSVTHATFTVERRYDASPERVVAAYADPTVKARWFLDALRTEPSRQPATTRG